MHHFFVEPELLRQATLSSIRLPDKIAHQVRDVLHIVVGEQIVLLDNSGTEFLSYVNKSGRDGVEVSVEERRAGKSEGNVSITLYQGLLKSARFELILEKCTELGVSRIVPTLCRRSMAGLEEAGPAKLQRWQRIIQEAAEQCGRAVRPELLPIRTLMHTLADLTPETLALMPWEEEHELSLRSILRAFQAVQPAKERSSIALFIGPEGGLLPEEVELARRHGVRSVSLGTRILRAETAAIASIANILYELEDF